MNEVLLFEQALRAAARTRPDPGLESELVPRLARIARDASLEASAVRITGAGAGGRSRSPRSRISLVARVGIAAAALPLLLAGLAFAGVTVPDAARSAFESVGIELPNQPSGHEAEKASGATEEQSSDQGTPANSATGGDQQASGKAHGKAKGKSKTAESSKPGRRVRRHGEGPIPGPASPPEGRALGHSKPNGSEQSNARSGGTSRGKAGTGSGKGQGALHGAGQTK